MRKQGPGLGKLSPLVQSASHREPGARSRIHARLLHKAVSETLLHARGNGTSAVKRDDVATAGAGVTGAMAIFGAHL
jgi:hypothetical protein